MNGAPGAGGIVWGTKAGGRAPMFGANGGRVGGGIPGNLSSEKRPRTARRNTYEGKGATGTGAPGTGGTGYPGTPGTTG